MKIDSYTSDKWIQCGCEMCDGREVLKERIQCAGSLVQTVSSLPFQFACTTSFASPSCEATPAVIVQVMAVIPWSSGKLLKNSPEQPRTAHREHQSSPEQARTAQNSSEQPRTAQSSPEQPRAPQSSPEQPRAAQSSPEQPRAAQNSPEQPRTAQSSPGQPRAAQSSPEQPREAQNNPEQPRTAQSSRGPPRAKSPSGRGPSDRGPIDPHVFCDTFVPKSMPRALLADAPLTEAL